MLRGMYCMKLSFTLWRVVQLCTYNFCIRGVPIMTTHCFPYTTVTNLDPSFIWTSAIYQSNISIGANASSIFYQEIININNTPLAL